MREGRAQNENRGRDKQLLGVGGHEVKYLSRGKSGKGQGSLGTYRVIETAKLRREFIS